MKSALLIPIIIVLSMAACSRGPQTFTSDGPPADAILEQNIIQVIGPEPDLEIRVSILGKHQLKPQDTYQVYYRREFIRKAEPTPNTDNKDDIFIHKLDNGKWIMQRNWPPGTYSWRPIATVP